MNLVLITPVFSEGYEKLNLLQAVSLPIALSTNNPPSLISPGSLPVSFTITKNNSLINLSSKAISFNTTLLPSTIKLASLPVSVSLSNTKNSIKFFSKPVSYSLNTYNKDLYKVTSQNVSYKVYNGTPILELVSPNLLPITHNEKSIDITITGKNFVKDSIVSIGTLQIQTKYTSTNELIATIPTNYLNKENSFEIYVSNPPPNGGISTSFNVMVINPTPIAKIKAAPSLGITPQVVIFDARDSFDLLEKYYEQPLKYSWDFGDNNNTSLDPACTHSYTKPGKYIVTLTITNAYGKTNTTTKEVEIRDKDEAPIIDAVYSIKELDDFLEVTFDASMSQDPENDPIKYTWDFGDSTSSFKSLTTHKYSNKGNYIPKITVTDSFGVSSIKYLEPINYPGPNESPIPIINISQNTGYLMLVQEELDFKPQLKINLSSKESYDKDGSITSYKWTIKSDNNEEIFKTEEKEFSYTFTQAGSYTATLKITDNRNKTIEKTELITVLKPDPIASATTDKTSGNAPLEIQFNSNGSRDFNGEAVSTEWDFGDRSPYSTELNPTHTYNIPGAYLPTLIVKTKDGRTKKINTKTILVSENNGPVGIISTFESVKLGIANEAMIKLSAKNSYDPHKNQMIYYSWSWIAHQLDKDGNLTNNSEAINSNLLTTNSEEFSYTFTTPGQYIPVLEIKTEDGRSTKAFGETITISPGQEPIAIAKVTSINSLKVKFDASGSFDPKPNGEITSYLWNFGDGETSNETSPEHIYKTQGDYNAKLIIEDNRGFKSIALTNTIKILSNEDLTKQRIDNIVENKEVKERIFKLQTVNNTNQDGISFSKDEEKPIDSIPPKITLSIENPNIQNGETLFFNAHITDDIDIELVGYKLLDENKNTILETLEEAPGNNRVDNSMSSINYTKEINISTNIKPGKYKLLVFAKDKADNWLGQTTTNELVSSDIIIRSGKTTSSNIYTEGKESSEKSNVDIINKLNSIDADDRSNLIQILASDKDPRETHSLTRQFLAKKENNLKERTYTIIKQTGTPSTFGTPSTNNIVNTITPTISVVMTISSSTPYIDIGFMGGVTETNFGGVSVNISNAAPQSPQTQEIQKYLSITCAPGRDCSIFNEALTQINQPVITYGTIGNDGKPIGIEKTFVLDSNDFKPNEPIEKYTPVIDTITPNEVTIGQGTFNLTVKGSMFNPGTVIYWDTEKLDTAYIDNNTLSANVPAWFTATNKITKIKVQKPLSLNSNFLESNYKELKTLPRASEKRYFLFNTLENLNKLILGNDLTLQRDGGNVYISNDSTVFKEAGSITIPFTISSDSSLNLEINGSLIHSTLYPKINLYHNNTLITSLINNQKCLRFEQDKEDKACTENQNWNINVGTLPVGSHTIKLSLPDISNQTIFILDNIKFNFTNTTKPLITSIEPQSIYPLNETDRTLTISGKDFGTAPNVIYKGKQLETSLISKNKIKVTLPKDLELLENQIYLNLVIFNNQSKIKSEDYAIGLKSPLKILKLTPNYEFIPYGINGPYGKLDISLISEDGFTPSDVAYVGVFDDKGNVIINPYSTGKVNYNLFNPLEFNTSFTLPYDLPKGNYHIISTLGRKNINANSSDYSNIEVIKLFNDLINKTVKDKNDFDNRLNNIPTSHYKTFYINDNAIPILMISAAYTTNNISITQENQDLLVSADLRGNILNNSNTKIAIDFEDVEKSFEYKGTSVVEKHKYKLDSNTKFKLFEIKVKVFKDGLFIGESKPELVYVYKDLPPIAIAKVDTENYSYQGNAPFKTTFIDKSYDPNDELSNFTGALDKTNPEKNTWQLFKYKDSISNELIDKEDLSIKDNQILNGGKTFLTGVITNPGTYYARLEAFDNANNSDTTQSESIQVIQPTQMLLIHAGFENTNSQAFEYNEDGNINIQFHSEIQIRDNKPPTNIIYKWDFGDGYFSSETNPIHLYKKNTSNQDRIDYHPELTVSAVWKNSYSETWSSKAGTISIIDKPEFVALDIIPDKINGETPLTVIFMVSDKSFVKNATITSYSFDYGDGKVSASTQSSLVELQSKVFAHTYTQKGIFHPTLKVQIKENPDKEFKFNCPIISTNSLQISSIELLEPPDNFTTNEPLITLKTNLSYTNPYSYENRLFIHITDEVFNESIIELNPHSNEQTISLDEGINTYWFELINSDGTTEKSLPKKIILDTISPTIKDISITSGSINTINIKGHILEKQFQKLELVIDNEVPIILSDSEITAQETDEYIFTGTLENKPNAEYLLTLRVFDYAGNISEETYEIKQGNSKIFFQRKENKANNTDTIEIISNNTSSTSEAENNTINKTIISGKPFSLNLFTCFSDDKNKSLTNVEAQLDIKDIKLKELKYNNKVIEKSQDELNNILNSLIYQKTLGCVDISAIGGITLTKIFCAKALNANACMDNCVHVDGSVCNIPIFYSNTLNTNTNQYFNPEKNLLDPKSQWDIGSYEFLFEVNENKDSCTNYGTCLGKNNAENKTSQTYTYTIEVKRDPSIKTKIINSEDLSYDSDNEINVQITAIDDLPFINSSNNEEKRTPILDLEKIQWEGLANPKSAPQAQITSQTINPKNPKEYIFELRIKINPQSFNKINFEIPVYFPGDYYNPQGINNLSATFTLKVNTSLSADITYPENGTIITNKTNIQSEVILPSNTEGNFFTSKCKNNLIHFGILTNNSTQVQSIENTLGKKLESFGIVNNSKYKFNNILNFNLKNILKFKPSFLNGNIFGPLRLFGEYSTSCSSQTINYTGKSKTYILLDNITLVKTKCKGLGCNSINQNTINPKPIIESQKPIINGKPFSKEEAKDTLTYIGLLQEGESDEIAIKKALKLFAYLTKNCNSNYLKYQITDGNTISGSCTINILLDNNGNPIPLPDPETLPEPTLSDLENLISIKEAINGLKEAGINNIKDIINPNTLGIASLLIALSISGVVSVPATIITLATYGGNFLSALSVLEELNTKYNLKPNPWKLSYAVGRLGLNIALIKGSKDIKETSKVSENILKIKSLDEGTYIDSAKFLFEEEKTISLSTSLENEKLIKKEQLTVFSDALYENLTKAITEKRKEINILFKDLDEVAKSDLRTNVIYRTYSKDLNNTPEDLKIVKEQILSPAIEHAAKSKALGVENGFLFSNKFYTDTNDQLYKSTNLSDLQSQGYLLGEIISYDKRPEVVYRVINDHQPLTMLAGDRSGAVFTFHPQDLTKEQIINEIRNNKINFFSKAGLDPSRYKDDLKLLEIRVKENNVALYKPTNKDSGFNEVFRYNASNEPYGKTLDLNNGLPGLQEFIMKEYNLPHEAIIEYKI